MAYPYTAAPTPNISPASELHHVELHHMENRAYMQPPVEFQATDVLNAVARKDIAYIQRAIQSGFNINSGDYDARSPLHVASNLGYLDVVKFIVENGADVNIRDTFDGTPLDDAMRRDHKDVVSYLIASGARIGSNKGKEVELVDAASHGDLQKVKTLVENGIAVTCSDYDKRTPLHLAVCEGHYEVAKYLLEHGADKNAEDRWGMTPIKEAMRRTQRTGEDRMTALLIPAHEHPPASLQVRLFVGLFTLWEFMIMILFGIFCVYEHDTVGKAKTDDDVAAAQSYFAQRYPLFQDIHVMIFIGFGYLMTFLRKYGYTSVGVTFLLGAFCIQWYILTGGFWKCVFNNKWEKLELSVYELTLADFAAGAVLISFGGLLGKCNPLQLLTMAAIEVPLYALNEEIGLKLKITDIGGSMVIHMFGAYFGLACSWALSPAAAFSSAHNAAVYHSDMFAMIGTVFLWMFWPSFNGGPGIGQQSHRAVVNTLLSLTGSCLAAFIASCAIRRERRFSMVDVQNATLAGGVAMGTCADLMILPGPAIAIGYIAGTLSVVGYVYIQPFLEQKLRLHDTCGIHNLHGMPSLLGAFAGCIACAVAEPEKYGSTFGLSFVERSVNPSRTASKQALLQLAYIGITLGIAIVSGVITGFFLRLPFFVSREEGDPTKVSVFTDHVHWETPELEIPYFFDVRGEVSRGAGNQAELQARMEALEEFMKVQQDQRARAKKEH
eukprot:TRINITY_DN129_c0_g1_i3.p1 TRINITY_DN129_c0_g1~~TRINITY_DN129_c0_g1_i3.p1  ORF type:complete len:722 (-),score=98.16 TRINITY_DN129_c0_g1_i3:101-2266(-)